MRCYINGCLEQRSGPSWFTDVEFHSQEPCSQMPAPTHPSVFLTPHPVPKPLLLATAVNAVICLLIMPCNKGFEIGELVFSIFILPMTKTAL